MTNEERRAAGRAKDTTDWATARAEQTPEEVLREIAPRVARMLEHWGKELFPASADGRAHFARVMMDSAAYQLRAALDGRNAWDDEDLPPMPLDERFAVVPRSKTKRPLRVVRLTRDSALAARVAEEIRGDVLRTVDLDEEARQARIENGGV